MYFDGVMLGRVEDIERGEKDSVLELRFQCSCAKVSLFVNGFFLSQTIPILTFL